MTRKHFLAFEWTDESFAERFGAPEAVDAAVGKIVLNFAELEFELDQSLALVGVLPVRSEATGPAAASFRAKLDRLVSLVPHLDGLVRFNTGAAPAVGVFAEFRLGCLEAAALYGQVLTGPKRTAETPGAPDPAQPLNSPPQFSTGSLNADRLLDIADYICWLAIQLDEVFLDVGAFEPEAA